MSEFRRRDGVIVPLIPWRVLCPHECSANATMRGIDVQTWTCTASAKYCDPWHRSGQVPHRVQIRNMRTYPMMIKCAGSIPDDECLPKNRVVEFLLTDSGEATAMWSTSVPRLLQRANVTLYVANIHRIRSGYVTLHTEVEAFWRVDRRSVKIELDIALRTQQP